MEISWRFLRSSPFMLFDWYGMHGAPLSGYGFLCTDVPINFCCQFWISVLHGGIRNLSIACLILIHSRSGVFLYCLSWLLKLVYLHLCLPLPSSFYRITEWYLHHSLRYFVIFIVVFLSLFDYFMIFLFNIFKVSHAMIVSKTYGIFDFLILPVRQSTLFPSDL